MSTPETQKALALARQMRLLPFKHGQDVATTIEALAKRVQELEAQAAAMRAALKKCLPHVQFLVARNPQFEEPREALYTADAALATDAGKDLLADKSIVDWISRQKSLLISIEPGDPDVGVFPNTEIAKATGKIIDGRPEIKPLAIEGTFRAACLAAMKEGK